MDLNQVGDGEARFAAYLAELGSVVGQAVRLRPLRDYCTGLMLPGERKTVEPMAARTAPARTAAQHQSLHFVGNATWSDEDVLAKVRQMVLPAIEKAGPIEACKASTRSACTTNIAVSSASRPIARWQCPCRLPTMSPPSGDVSAVPAGPWAKDRARRNKAGVPKEIKFRTKPEIALEQIRWACEAGLPRGLGLMDTAYGNDSRLRAGMTALGVLYVAGILPNTLMWRPGTGPRRKDRPLNNTGRRDEPDLVSAKEVMLALPKQAWRTVTWREGSADRLSSRFARVRVRVGYNKPRSCRRSGC